VLCHLKNAAMIAVSRSPEKDTLPSITAKPEERHVAGSDKVKKGE
jgi:hypothetical protein